MTDKEKQIEEMAQFMAVISHLECGRKPCEECKWCGCERSEEADCTDYLIAEHLYNAGYRKQSEVAREIFEEIENTLNQWIELYYTITVSTFDSIEQAKARASESVLRAFRDYIAELKKKYTESDNSIVSTKWKFEEKISYEQPDLSDVKFTKDEDNK